MVINWWIVKIRRNRRTTILVKDSYSLRLMEFIRSSGDEIGERLGDEGRDYFEEINVPEWMAK